MNKYLVFITVLCFGILAACGNSSSNGTDNNQNMADFSTEEHIEDKSGSNNAEVHNDQSEQKDTALKNKKSAKDSKEADRKIIYTANMDIEVKDYENALNDIENQIDTFGGYIVDSSLNDDEGANSKHGQITARVPQADFKDFIALVEESSSKVINSSTTGEDVTEEYVDLDSRLKSKKVVEERLLSFMEDADKTEDLLQISDDLANVQEEIEELTGQLKYLDNKSDLATVSISMQEKNEEISGTGKDQLNTWDKTKQQLLKSINFIIVAFSSVFVFIVGNLPVFLLLGIIGLIIFLIIKRSTRNKKGNG